MAKARKKSGSKKIKPKLFILCEAHPDKSEDAYLREFIKDYPIPGNRVEIVIHRTKKTSGKELVNQAKDLREFDGDMAWVVYDKDGYTKHAQTFSHANASSVNIAFSSISFEFWILLHFCYTTKPYQNSAAIIHDLKHTHGFDYSKKSQNIYKETKSMLPIAMKRAEQIQKECKKSYATPRHLYKMNPYTDFDKLLKKIISFTDEQKDQ